MTREEFNKFYYKDTTQAAGKGWPIRYLHYYVEHFIINGDAEYLFEDSVLKEYKKRTYPLFKVLYD